MAKLNSIWVIAEDPSALAEMVSMANAFGEEVTLVFSGPLECAGGAQKAYHFDGDNLFAYTSEIVELVKSARPSLVLTETSKNGRLLAGLFSAALGAAVQTDAMEISVSDANTVTKRMVYGGAALQTEESAAATAIVCVGPGSFEPAPLDAVREIVELKAAASPVRFIEKRVKEKSASNLSAAKLVVGAGRGCASEQSMDLIRGFADAIGADVGCSRPMAEDEKLLPRDLYIGVSGAIIKPEVYVAVGVSGQVQHMVGVSQAGTIIAINKDKNAPIFTQCDFGLVGAVETVIPVLTEKLKR